MKNRSNLSDDLFNALSSQGRACANRAAHPRNERVPVVDVTADTMWNYEYQAKNSDATEILASDSLRKLKMTVSDRGWRMAWITARNGMLSIGQRCVYEYPFLPRKR
ncbi:protein of unknown function [Acidithiobacillus ferrivorans]|uniref:Uncharacterized protein n=1 Tax=Acidithiobacillus ferrivorans TaxID=160808 RepID=A0A060UQN4_9PROT|nr:hypothetical protein [Acidithiobacillus ferrivorans]MBU2765820.1 hypothetical protein [Acidithiobacillus ferrivorans]CDQ10576.1 hypothetical protein AFERRI_400357 [Acidithiobacillus ferrivorans]SMH64607.1 protein of unknown function [Acidithiobacillus ferrivorans]